MILLDTHVVLWARATPDRLSDTALRAMHTADALAIASITLWEIAMLAGKGRVRPDGPLDEYLNKISASVTVVALDAAVAARSVVMASRMTTADPADHVICATADVRGMSLISADRQVASSEVQVIW